MTTDELEPRYKVLKASGSRYAYVIDTHCNKTIDRFDVLKTGGWELAEKMRDQLNAEMESKP